MHLAPSLSPDGDRIAVLITDLIEERRDLFVIDVVTGRQTRITEHAHMDVEWAMAPVWSPDGTQLAYIAKRDGNEGVYRKSADGRGEEELLYQHPGANMWIGDWSQDGEYLSVSTADFTESFLYVLPMSGEGERDIRQIMHSDAFLGAGSFSPDGKSLSYSWMKGGEAEIYVKEIDSDAAGQAISGGKGLFLLRGPWVEEPNSIHYLATGEILMAATVDAQAAEVATQTLFTLSPAIRPGPEDMSVSRDGDLIVIAVPHAPQLEQITLLDREGNVIKRLGEPSNWRNPALSPDGKKVAVRAWIPDTDSFDIWTFDIESGESVAVTHELEMNDWPVWSPDSTELVYLSLHDILSRIHRRKSADGSGSEAELFEYEPGAFLVVSDWSPDGNFVSFNDISWGVIYVLPLGNDGRAADGDVLEWLRDEYQVAQGKFSPDGRYIALPVR